MQIDTYIEAAATARWAEPREESRTTRSFHAPPPHSNVLMHGGFTLKARRLHGPSLSSSVHTVAPHPNPTTWHRIYGTALWLIGPNVIYLLHRNKQKDQKDAWHAGHLCRSSSASRAWFSSSHLARPSARALECITTSTTQKKGRGGGASSDALVLDVEQHQTTAGEKVREAMYSVL